MRKFILAAQTLILILTILTSAFALGKTTIDPNTPGNKPASQVISKDPRLDQKITYQVKLRPIADMTDDLTQLTGITFLAGRSKSDWRVREDCTTIMAKDTTLSTLMDSIAHVMKFKWVKTGDAPNWTYRLVEDSAAIAKVKQREEEYKKLEIANRKKCWDKLQTVSKMTEPELEKIRDDEPMLYRFAKAGVVKPIVEFIEQVPSVKDAWFADQELELSSTFLPINAQQLLVKAVRAQLQMEYRYAPDDIYYPSMIDGLDNKGSQMFVQLAKSGPSSFTLPLSITNARSDFYVRIKFGGERSEIQRLVDKAYLRAYEENRSVGDVMKETRSQRVEAINKLKPQIWISSYTQEPFLDHPDDPALSKPIKNEIATKTITSLVASLADTSGFAIVTDDFRGRSKFTIAKGTKVREILDDISNSRYYNWNRNAQAIELWDVNWYDNREARVSNAWHERMRKKFQEAGTLDIDDLAEIATLSLRQLNRNIDNDSVLKYVREIIWKQRNYLKIYNSLTSAQRLILLSNSGMAFTDLTPDQQQSVMKLILGRSAPDIENLDPANIGLRITCTKETQGKRFIYTLKGYTSLGEIPGQYRFRTPVYIAPPKPNDKKN